MNHYEKNYMHPGIWITKAEAKNHGATLKNILPDSKWNEVECLRVEIFFKWGNGSLVKPLKIKGVHLFDLHSDEKQLLLHFYNMPSSANE